ncbi:MAG: hypothetical protein ACT4OO_13655 [Nitrospiraceae bacterium]
MTRRQRAWLAVMAVLAGFFGGATTSIFLSGMAVAQPKARSVNAEEFLLLDALGQARAGIGLDAKGEVGFILTSKDGNRRLLFSPDERLALKLVDREGRVLWSAP